MEGVKRMLREVLSRVEAIDSRLMAIEAATLERNEVREISAESRKPIASLQELKEEGNYFEYVEAFVGLVSQVKLSDEEQVEMFLEGLKNQNHKLISILNPKTLQQAISYGRALTTDLDPKATNLDETSTVMEERKPNEMQKERKSHVNAKGDEEELVDQPKIKKKRGAVPRGLSTDSNVVKREEEPVAKRSLCNNAEEFEFQVEGSRLMDILVKSPYSNKGKEILGEGDNVKLEIQSRLDKEKKVLIIRDKGTGMTKEDLLKNLGIFTKSGTSAFGEKMQTNRDIDLVGQFEVGVYSVHLGADYVEVINKHNDDKQYVGKFKVDGVFIIYEDTGQEPLGRGTEIRLHLKEETQRYFLSHKYASKRPDFIILETEREGYPTKEELILEREVNINPVIPLPALYEVYMLPMNRTIKMTGYYKKMRLIVLVDSGNIHNFLEAAIGKTRGCPLHQVGQQKESDYLWQQNRDGNRGGQLPWVLQSLQANYSFVKQKGLSNNNIWKNKEGLALTSLKTIDSLWQQRDRFGSTKKDREIDSDGQQGSSNGVTWFAVDKDDRKDGRETVWEAEMRNPSGVNQNAEVNKIGCRYSVPRAELDESDWKKGNIKGADSNKKMAKEDWKLISAKKSSDSTMALVRVSHEGSPKEVVELSVALLRTLQLIARVGKSTFCSQEKCNEDTELFKSPAVMMVLSSIAIQETMKLCFQENTQEVKGTGNIELDMQMILSATAIGAQQNSVNSGTKGQSGPSLLKGLTIFQGETSSCYTDISTTVEVRRIGRLIYWTESRGSQENLTERGMHANAANAIVVGEGGAEVATAAYKKYLRYVVALLENQVETKILVQWIDRDFNEVTCEFLWNLQGKYPGYTLGDKGATKEGYCYGK